MRFRNRSTDDDSMTDGQVIVDEPTDEGASAPEKTTSDEASEGRGAADPSEPIAVIEDPTVVSFLDQPDDMPIQGLPKRGAFSVLRKAGSEFADDQGTDIAAALTYYGVLAIFPAALAVFSTLGLFGQGDRGVNAVLDVLRPLVSADFLKNIESPLQSLAHSDAAGVTFAVGLVAALWSASAYVGAFGRAMNRVYEVQEGRPFWRLRPMNFLVTILTTAMSAVGLVILIATGSVARSIGDKLGVGHQTVQVWDIAKWPVLLVLVIAIVALLYHLTPNIRQGRPRFLSIGASVAILVWIIASAGLGVYVANVHSYDRTYGSLAGIILALVWLWITNVALVFGAELDSELERARQLHRGIAAEEQLQLVPRSERRSIKAERRREKDAARGRAVREARAGVGHPDDRPF